MICVNFEADRDPLACVKDKRWLTRGVEQRYLDHAYQCLEDMREHATRTLTAAERAAREEATPDADIVLWHLERRLAALAETPAALTFGNQVLGTSSAAQFVTVANTSIPSVSVNGIAVAVSGAFSRSATSPGTCPATPTFVLASNGASCTIGVQFNPVAPAGTANGSVTVTAASGFTVGGSPRTFS